VSARLDRLADEILDHAKARARYVFAIAGAPGSGKSTLAEELLAALETSAPGHAALVPMDGYHFDNAVLAERGDQDRKGAPDTFDADGLASDLGRILESRGDVAVPVFDRTLDLSRAGARMIHLRHSVILVEGNYLLLDRAPWDRLAGMFDRTLFIDVAPEELRRRLVARWVHYGLEGQDAEVRVGRDMENVETVIASSRAPDIVWRQTCA
jgi:pantothenate kinase